jgi:hypothetical protein
VTKAGVKNRLAPPATSQVPSISEINSTPTPTVAPKGKKLGGKAAKAAAEAAMKGRPIGYGIGGGAVSKAIFKEMERVLKEYAPNEPFEEVKADSARCLAMVSMFRTQINIFKKQFEAQLQTNEAAAQ